MKTLTVLALILLTGCAAHDAVFVTPHQFGPEAYDSPEEWAMVEARRLHRDTRDNCLDVARTAQKMLASQGVASEIVAYSTRAKGDHVALCTARTCLDNGLLANGLFRRGEPRVPELSRN